MKLLTPIIFLALAAGTFYWFINPTYADIGVLRSDQKEYEAAIVRAQKALDRRNDLVNTFNGISDTDLKRLQTLLPDNVDNLHLVVDLNAMAAKYGTGIKNIKISDNNPAASRDTSADSNSKAYGSITMSFGTTMSYENFQRFLSDLQQNLRLSDVVGVDFSSNPTGVYDYNITLKTYVMR